MKNAAFIVIRKILSVISVISILISVAIYVTGFTAMNRLNTFDNISTFEFWMQDFGQYPMSHIKILLPAIVGVIWLIVAQQLKSNQNHKELSNE